MRAIVRRWRGALFAATLLSLSMAAVSQAEDRGDLGSLDRQIEALTKSQRFDDALPLAEKAVATAERIEGADSAEVASRLLKLAEVLSELGRFAEAASNEQRALTIRERLLGPEHPLTAQAMISLAGSLKELKRLDEAAALNRRALAIYETTRGEEAAELAEPLVQLDEIARLAGRTGERADLNRRLLAVREKALGADHPDLVPALLNLAKLAVDERRLDEAQYLLERAHALRVAAGGAEDPIAFEILWHLANLAAGQGRPQEAEPLLRRVLAYREKTAGAKSLAVAAALESLGGALKDLTRFDEAVSATERALAIHEETSGKDSPSLLPVLSALAKLRSTQGLFEQVEHLRLRSLAIRQRQAPPDDPDTLAEMNELAGLYQAQGRYARAEPLYRQVIAGLEVSKGAEATDLASPLYLLSMQLVTEARYGEAEPMLRRALAIQEKAYGRDDPRLAEALAALSRFYLSQNDGEQAEPFLKRILSIASSRGGIADSVLAITLNHLSQLYQDQGRSSEALPLAQQALALTERVSGPEHPVLALMVNNLAVLYADLGREEESEALYKQSLAKVEKALPGDHPLRIKLQLVLATHYRGKHRFEDAEPLLEQALASSLRLFGENNPQVADALRGLGGLRGNQGRTGEALALLERAASILERTLGRDDPAFSAVHDDMATLALADSNWTSALEHWVASTDAIIHRAQRGTTAVSTASGRASDEAVRWSRRFRGAVKAAWRSGDPGTLGREAFERAQWAQGSAAATSLAQMAARSAKGDEALSRAVRERQDLVGQWQLLDAARLAAIAQPLDKRDKAAEAGMTARLATIDTRLGEIDARLGRDFPDYAALASAQPASVADVQASLGDDEALVLLVDTEAMPPAPEETFIWVVTRADMRWVRSDVGTPGLTKYVAALRCGLDAAAWRGEGRAACRELLGLEGDPDRRQPLPFDPGIAHELYEALFGDIEDLIKGKRLLIVSSGPLSRLPLQTLVSAAPKGTGLAGVRWLIRDHAVTVLPAVSSLKALRRVGRASRAPKPMIGFGNPLLDGQQSDPVDGPYFKELAAAARAEKACHQTKPLRSAALRGLLGNPEPLPQPAGVANLAHLRMQAPLPETADELCAVARDLKAGSGDIHLAARATEAEVKRLSASGDLARYRIVHFATHGTLAGELRGTREPGLILTPPETATPEDDGFLSGSEISSLKLDADWVILSACNTAGGEGGATAEALSGLARAFFYAGARALLVSHWAVDSRATVKLITTAVGETARNAKPGRAEALRRAMLALIDDGSPRDAHPSRWAPFVVVGEGGAGR